MTSRAVVMPAGVAGAVKDVSHSKTKLDALTSLRFFAAALIVFYHSLGYLGTKRGFADNVVLTQGITFFFILSGFLMMYVHPMLDRSGAVRFWVARFARIWPLHVATYVLAWWALPAALFVPATYTRRSIVINIALMQKWDITRAFDSFNNVSWTLSIEAFFYLAFPFLLLLARRRGAELLLVGALLPLLSAALATWLLSPTPFVQTLGFVLFRTPVVYLWEFGLGMATAVLWRRWQWMGSIPRLQATFVEAAVISVTLIVMWYSVSWGNALALSAALGGGGAGWLQLSYLPGLPFAALIFVMGFGRGWFARALAWRPLIFLGEISYALYLTHNTVLAWYFAHVAQLRWLPAGLQYPIYWLAILTVAACLWLAIERPFRRLIVVQWDRLMQRRRTVEVVASPVSIVKGEPQLMVAANGKDAD